MFLIVRYCVSRVRTDHHGGAIVGPSCRLDAPPLAPSFTRCKTHKREHAPHTCTHTLTGTAGGFSATSASRRSKVSRELRFFFLLFFPFFLHVHVRANITRVQQLD